MEFHHAVAYGAHYLELRWQLVALFNRQYFAEEAVDHPVFNVENRLGVAVANCLVQQETERSYVDAVALTVANIDETDALGLEDAVGEHLDSVVD